MRMYTGIENPTVLGNPSMQEPETEPGVEYLGLKLPLLNRQEFEEITLIDPGNPMIDNNDLLCYVPKQDHIAPISSYRPYCQEAGRSRKTGWQEAVTRIDKREDLYKLGVNTYVFYKPDACGSNAREIKAKPIFGPNIKVGFKGPIGQLGEHNGILIIDNSQLEQLKSSYQNYAEDASKIIPSLLARGIDKHFLNIPYNPNNIHSFICSPPLVGVYIKQNNQDNSQLILPAFVHNREYIKRLIEGRQNGQTLPTLYSFVIRPDYYLSDNQKAEVLRWINS